MPCDYGICEPMRCSNRDCSEEVIRELPELGPEGTKVGPETSEQGDWNLELGPGR
jgi:hypothetical protein